MLAALLDLVVGPGALLWPRSGGVLAGHHARRPVVVGLGIGGGSHRKPLARASLWPAEPDGQLASRRCRFCGHDEHLLPTDWPCSGPKRPAGDRAWQWIVLSLWVSVKPAGWPKWWLFSGGGGRGGNPSRAELVFS